MVVLLRYCVIISKFEMFFFYYYYYYYFKCYLKTLYDISAMRKSIASSLCPSEMPNKDLLNVSSTQPNPCRVGNGMETVHLILKMI